MDSNLYFRFSIPGWTGLLTGVTLAWAAGTLRLESLADNKESLEIAAAVIVAVLGAPAVGFLLNTIVVAICDLFRIGPVHSRAYGGLWEQCSASPHVTGLFPGKDKDRSLAALMAHFEYRLDSDGLISWRRRQCAAFFGNYANVLAILASTGLSARYWWTSAAGGCVALALVALALLIASLLFNAHRAKTMVARQQQLWVNSLRPGAAVACIDLLGRCRGDRTGPDTTTRPSSSVTSGLPRVRKLGRRPGRRRAGHVVS